MLLFLESKEIDVKDALTTEEKKKENPHDLRYEKLNLPRERREEIGKKTKRILDYGRAEFIRQKLGLEVKLIYYCTQETSLENVLLLAK